MHHVMTTVQTPTPSTVLVTFAPTTTTTSSLLQRLELRVALWLIMRTARRQGPELNHAEQHRRRRNSAARARREQAALRAWCTQCMHH